MYKCFPNKSNASYQDSTKQLWKKKKSAHYFIPHDSAGSIKIQRNLYNSSVKSFYSLRIYTYTMVAQIHQSLKHWAVRLSFFSVPRCLQHFDKSSQQLGTRKWNKIVYVLIQLQKKTLNHCEIRDKSDLLREGNCRHAKSVRISPVHYVKILKWMDDRYLNTTEWW